MRVLSCLHHIFWLTVTWILYSALSLLSLACLIIFLVDSTRVFLIKEAVQQFSPIPISISQLRSPSLSHWKASSIKIYSDEQKPWIEMNTVDLKWSAKHLFNKEIRILSLHVEDITIHKQHNGHQKPTDSKFKHRDKNTLNIKQLPNIKVQSLDISKLNIDRQFLNSTATPTSPIYYSYHATLNASWNWLGEKKLIAALNGINDNQSRLNLVVTGNELSLFNIQGSITDKSKGTLSESVLLPQLQGIQVTYNIDAAIESRLFKFDFHNVAMKTGDQNIKLTGKLSHYPTESKTDIHDFVIHTNNKYHSLHGTVSPEKLDLDIDINQFPTDLLRLWQSTVPEGSIDSDLRVSGTLKSPHLSGEISVDLTYLEEPITLKSNILSSLNRSSIKDTKIHYKAFSITSPHIQFGHNSSNLTIEALTLVHKNSTIAQLKGRVSLEKDLYESGLDIEFSSDINSLRNIIGEIENSNINTYPDVSVGSKSMFKGTLKNIMTEGYVSVAPNLNTYKLKTSNPKTSNFSTPKLKNSQTLKINTLETLSSHLAWKTDNTNITATFSISGPNNLSENLTILLPKNLYLPLLQNNNALPQVPLEGKVLGNLDLSTIGTLLGTDIHALSGTIKTDISLAGSLNDPVIFGNIDVSNAQYENLLNGLRVNDFNCQINAQPAKLIVGDCSASDGHDGLYQLTGFASYPIYRSPFSLTLHLNNVNPMSQPYIEHFSSDGNIYFMGGDQTPTLSSDININRLVIDLDAIASSNIDTIKTRSDKEKHTPKISTHHSTSPTLLPELDLQVKAENQAFIKGRGLNAEISGSAQVSGPANQPLLRGDFKIIRGEFDIFNKTFKLTKGNLKMVGQSIIMGAQGQYKRNDQAITLHIQGTQDDLTISFTSIPAMAEDEILAYIIFGKSLQNITPFEAYQFAAAIQKIKGKKPLFDPLDRSRKLIGADRLTVESGENPGSPLEIGIGKYLSDNVYLELNRTTSETAPWKANVEIELSPKLNLESSVNNTTGAAGIELNWQEDY